MKRPAVAIVVVWLAAANLRAAIFGLQPVLPDIRHELGLSFVATGGLTSLSIAAIGVASIPGVLVGTWLGARRTVTLMAIGIGVASLARLLPPATAMIFGGTAVLAVCVAFSQPSAVVLLQRWFSGNVRLAGSVFSNGILLGGTIGASVTPLIAAWAGWRISFVLWGVVSLIVALLWVRLTPPADAPLPRLRIGEALRNPRAWQIAALFTFQNLAYFTAAAWLPFLLAGRTPAYVAWVFTCLNLLPIFPLLLLPVLRWSYATSAAYYGANGVLVIVGAAGLALGTRDLAWVMAFLIGFGCAAAFVGSMALLPLVARGEAEASSMTAVVFTAGYLFAFSGPLIAGSLADRTHAVTSAFWPSVVGGLLMAVVGLLVPRLLGVKPGADGGAYPAQ